MNRYIKNLLNRKIIKIIFRFLLVIVAGYLLMLLSFILNPVKEADLRLSYEESIRIHDNRGRLLREVVNSEGVRARWIDLEDISPLVVQAAIAIEDERFYEHRGVDAGSMLRAAFQNVSSGTVVSGASTITMQLARLLYRHPRNFWGKIQQIYNAIRLEFFLDKDTILIQYLNRAPYGAGTVGIEAAAHRFFDKPSSHLSISEAALLAGLTQSPSILNPLNNFEGAKERQKMVLQQMAENGNITEEELVRSLEEPLILQKDPPPFSSMHFTEYALSRLSAESYQGDIYTSLDGELNGQIEILIRDHIEALHTGGLTDASVIVIDNKKACVIGWVGSADFWNDEKGSVDGVTALRQPGSTIKPFTYALSFERGYTPASVVADIETEFINNDDSLYIPQNYSGEYYGPVLIREALGRSLNVPAIRIAHALTAKDLLERLRVAGFSSLNKEATHYGLGLTLGSGEVSLLELAAGYSAFAREGIYKDITIFRDKKEPLFSPERDSAVFSKEVSYLITDILSDENLRMRAFGPTNPLIFNFPIAVKTGTSNNWRDNWVVGYTEEYTIAVWGGNFEGRPMNQMSGAVGGGPLFNKVVNLVMDIKLPHSRPKLPLPPDTIEYITICSLSGMTPTEFCPHVSTVYIIKEEEERGPCNLHKEVSIDKRNGLLASGKCPEQFVEKRVYEFLPSVYNDWLEAYGRFPPPTRYSPLCPPDGITVGALVVTKPRKNDIFLIEPGYDLSTQTLELGGEVDPPIPGVRWYVDGSFYGEAPWPYTINWQLEKGVHTIHMEAEGKKSDPLTFEVR